MLCYLSYICSVPENYGVCLLNQRMHVLGQPQMVSRNGIWQYGNIVAMFMFD